MDFFVCFIVLCLCVSVCVYGLETCECFVFKCTHALTVLNEKFSILHETLHHSLDNDLSTVETLYFPLIFIIKVFKCAIAC